jgi:hypothetical protein
VGLDFKKVQGHVQEGTHAKEGMFSMGYVVNDECGFSSTRHKNNHSACVRDMQIEHPVNALGQTVLSSLIG